MAHLISNNIFLGVRFGPQGHEPMVGPVRAHGPMGTWWARSGPGPVHSSPVRSHDECDQLDSAWRQAGCRFADCRLQICRLQSAVLSNPTLCRQAADLQIADFVYPKPLRWQAGRRFADFAGRFVIPLRRMGPWSIIGGPGPQAPWDQIINTSFGPWVQAHWDPRTGVISINTSFGPWAQSGALGPSDRGYLFFIFIFGSQIG